MKLIYDSQTDALYVELREGQVEESEEVAPGFVLDLDSRNNVLGIDIDADASKVVDLLRLEIEGLSVSLDLRSPQRSKTG